MRHSMDLCVLMVSFLAILIEGIANADSTTTDDSTERLPAAHGASKTFRTSSGRMITLTVRSTLVAVYYDGDLERVCEFPSGVNGTCATCER
jgi:hypothetical protein